MNEITLNGSAKARDTDEERINFLLKVYADCNGVPFLSSATYFLMPNYHQFDQQEERYLANGRKEPHVYAHITSRGGIDFYLLARKPLRDVHDVIIDLSFFGFVRQNPRGRYTHGSHLLSDLARVEDCFADAGFSPCPYTPIRKHLAVDV